jgi:hypothetical protein
MYRLRPLNIKMSYIDQVLPPILGYGMPPSPRNKEFKKYVSGESQCSVSFFHI